MGLTARTTQVIRIRLLRERWTDDSRGYAAVVDCSVVADRLVVGGPLGVGICWTFWWGGLWLLREGGGEGCEEEEDEGGCEWRDGLHDLAIWCCLKETRDLRDNRDTPDQSWKTRWALYQ